MTPLVVAVVGFLACAIDLRTRRIPNVLTFSVAAAGLPYHAVTMGWTGFTDAAGGWLIGVALFFPFFLLAGLGAGDVKLLAAFGAWLGPSLTVVAALSGAILGAIAALVLIVVRRRLIETAMNLTGLIQFWMAAGLRPSPTLTLGRAETLRLPYAMPITAGALAALWLR